jgi:FkbM family methyltransferase
MAARELGSLLAGPGKGERALGLARSLAMYYGQPWRTAALRRLYREFLGPGDLAFDIGAHVGNRTRLWSRLGARVIAVEPQPDFAAWLRWQFRRDPRVTVLEQAVAAQPGSARLHPSPRTPTVSTLSADWIARVRTDQGFAGVDWAAPVEVPATTLDGLIGEYGLPRFCKIDVEGFEAEVLRGLSQPIAALSFEYLPAAIEVALAALEHLARLGTYRFNVTAGEQARFLWPEWRDTGATAGWLGARHAGEGSGDVYARLAG